LQHIELSLSHDLRYFIALKHFCIVAKRVCSCNWVEDVSGLTNKYIIAVHLCKLAQIVLIPTASPNELYTSSELNFKIGSGVVCWFIQVRKCIYTNQTNCLFVCLFVYGFNAIPNELKPNIKWTWIHNKRSGVKVSCVEHCFMMTRSDLTRLDDDGRADT